ncbi:MAG: hypothetical protein Q7T86_16720 [Hyphomicrobiaceae bacterium]|nr:hypothetical protein [Hyphomicrobiaceae bacterium]
MAVILEMKRDLYSVEALADFQAVLGAADRETGYSLPVALMTSRLWEAVDAGESDLLRLKAAVTGCATVETFFPRKIIAI